jgi:predicted amidohydrolase
MQYDLLIKNGYVVDYASAREGYFDVAVQNGMAQICPECIW